MPTLVATLQVKEDKIEEAKSFLKALAAEVLANEEGTLEYSVHQRQDDPKAFVLIERYKDDEALKIHGKNLGAKGGEFAAILAGRPEIARLDPI